MPIHSEASRLKRPPKGTKGAEMRVEQTIDKVIEAGWHVLDSDFDCTALQNWRQRAFECMNALLGPDHANTQYFKNYIEMDEAKKPAA
jgi:hypothetical protein